MPPSKQAYTLLRYVSAYLEENKTTIRSVLRPMATLTCVTATTIIAWSFRIVITRFVVNRTLTVESTFVIIC